MQIQSLQTVTLIEVTSAAHQEVTADVKYLERIAAAFATQPSYDPV